jgi:hypothetical protein
MGSLPDFAITQCKLHKPAASVAAVDSLAGSRETVKDLIYIDKE